MQARGLLNVDATLFLLLPVQSVYPNPASQTLYIDIDLNAFSALQQTQGQSGDKITKQATPVFQILLYNSFGQLMLQTVTQSSTNLNTSKLPNGLYLMYVYDGSDNKPVVRKIRIKH